MPVKTDTLTLILIGIILIAFMIGAYRLNAQSQRLATIANAQSQLIFHFDAVSPDSSPLDIECIKQANKTVYICNTFRR